MFVRVAAVIFQFVRGIPSRLLMNEGNDYYPHPLRRLAYPPLPQPVGPDKIKYYGSDLLGQPAIIVCVCGGGGGGMTLVCIMSDM